MPEDEKAWLRDEAVRVMERDLIEIPEGASSADDLSPADATTVALLDDLFWKQMNGRVSGELVAAVRPVGGGMKLAALEEIVAAEDVEGAGVMYVGDSITDAQPLAAVKAWGGVSLSFNGNGYALAAAEFAAASPDAGVAAELAKAFAGGGRDAVEAAVRAWPRPRTGERPDGPGARPRRPGGRGARRARRSLRRGAAKRARRAHRPPRLTALALSLPHSHALTHPCDSATVLCTPYFVRHDREALRLPCENR